MFYSALLLLVVSTVRVQTASSLRRGEGERTCDGMFSTRQKSVSKTVLGAYSCCNHPFVSSQRNSAKVSTRLVECWRYSMVETVRPCVSWTPLQRFHVWWDIQLSNCVETHHGKRSLKQLLVWFPFLVPLVEISSIAYDRCGCASVSNAKRYSSWLRSIHKYIGPFKWYMSCGTIMAQNLVETHHRNGSRKRETSKVSVSLVPGRSTKKSKSFHSTIIFSSQFSRFWLVWWLVVSPRVPF
jgi:hypothetical protein